MECPICNGVFSKTKEILIMVDRSFYCPYCWSRLLFHLDGKGKYLIEKDFTGDKWRSIKER